MIALSIRRALIFMFFLPMFLAFSSSCYDLTIFGPHFLSDGIGKVSACFEKTLQGVLPIRCISGPQGLAKNNSSSRSRDGIIIVTDPLLRFNKVWSGRDINRAKIKIAASVFEASRIPPDWTVILNRHFDAVVVPDEYVKKIYHDSGVAIPIFVVPYTMFLEDFLSQPLKNKAGDPFTFGVSATFIDRKNHVKLLNSFAAVFGNNPNFRLKLHSRFSYGVREVRQKLHEIVKEHNLTNVEIIEGVLSQKEYVEFISSLDCYVFISKGEGFSFTPREALASGIPVILSNNTAHVVVCKTGFVRVVPAKIHVPALYDQNKLSTPGGLFFDCKQSDVESALLEVYQNYAHYLSLAHKGRQWVKRYTINNLKSDYINLVKPKTLIFGSENKVTDNFLMTNSAKLYRKYKLLLKPRA